MGPFHYPRTDQHHRLDTAGGGLNGRGSRSSPAIHAVKASQVYLMEARTNLRGSV